MKKLLALVLFSTLASSAFGTKIKVVNNTNKNWSVKVYDSGLRTIPTTKNNKKGKQINLLKPGEKLISEKTTPKSTIQVTTEAGKRTAIGGGQKITLRKDVISDENTTIFIEDVRAKGSRCPYPINQKPEYEREKGANNTCFYIKEEKEPINKM